MQYNGYYYKCFNIHIAKMLGKSHQNRRDNANKCNNIKH